MPRTVNPALKHIRALQPLAERVAAYRFAHRATFPLCVRGSFSKCFEFLRVAYARKSSTVPHFFLVPSLRGICEDLIVLGFVRQLPTKDRNDLIGKLLYHELAERVALQKVFFAAAHPGQHVLSFKLPQPVGTTEQEIRAIWQGHGWPGLSRGVMPQTRQLAERIGLDVLGPLYDYLYRLTSGAVHFNPQAIFRTAWGEKPPRFRFSTHHFDAYHQALCQVYGSYMFCTYIELFRTVLRPSPTDLNHVHQLRKSLLLKPRWPEMVTWEEMNLPPPKSSILHLMARVAHSQKHAHRLHKRKKPA